MARAEITTVLGADDRPLREKISSASAWVSGKLKATGKGIAQGFGIGAGAGVAGAAAMAAARALYAGAKNEGDKAEAFLNVSQAINMSTDSLQTWTEANRQAGGKVEDSIGKLEKFQVAVESFAGDVNQIGDKDNIFNKLGVSAQDFISMDINSQLELVAKNLDNIGTKGVKDLFGRSGISATRAALKALNEGGGFEGAQKKVTIISNTRLQALRDAGDNLENAKNAAGKAVVTSAASLLEQSGKYLPERISSKESEARAKASADRIAKHNAEVQAKYDEKKADHDEKKKGLDERTRKNELKEFDPFTTKAADSMASIGGFFGNRIQFDKDNAQKANQLAEKNLEKQVEANKIASDLLKIQQEMLKAEQELKKSLIDG